MDVTDIKHLLESIADADIREFAYETGDFKITVKRGAEQVMVAQPQPVAPAAQPAAPAAPPAAQPAAPAPAAPAEAEAEPEDDKSHLAEVTAPIVGTFYAAPAPDAADYVKVGDRVEAGTVLCIIEAMKLMNEIEAEVAGTIAEILVRNEEPVEYGQPLFRIDPD